MSPEDSRSWLNAKDFIQTYFRAAVKNVTTGTFVKPEDRPEIVELKENGVQLKLPRKATALGHHLQIRIEKTKTPPQSKQGEAGLPAKVDFTGKVTQEEPFGENHKIVDLQFYQYNEQEWRNFLIDCLHRQRAVDSMMKKIQE